MKHRLFQYPYLEHLLKSYFHQDCYEFGETNEDIINDYIKTTHDYDRLGLRADIKRFLHAHPENVLEAMIDSFSMDTYPQDNNARMAAWLLEVASRLEAVP